MSIADKFFNSRYLNKESTRIAYEYVFRKYCKFHNETLDNLFLEAENDEKNMIPLKNRKIKSRLLDFQIYLSKNYKYNTVRNDMGKIKTFYKTVEIELPYLLQSKQFQHLLPPLKKY